MLVITSFAVDKTFLNLWTNSKSHYLYFRGSFKRLLTISDLNFTSIIVYELTKSNDHDLLSSLFLKKKHFEVDVNIETFYISTIL